jgi:hypothetical protein
MQIPFTGKGNPIRRYLLMGVGIPFPAKGIMCFVIMVAHKGFWAAHHGESCSE